MLVSDTDGHTKATHLPFLLERSAGTNGSLIGHVARQNPQWKQLSGREVLVVFHGPHAYISPTWYRAERMVPTWNYLAVHAYGTARLIEDPDAAIALLSDLTAQAEREMSTPWPFDPSDPFVRNLATQVVAFRIEITRLEGKWKLNQNHPEERRRLVIAALRAQGGDDDIEIAARMEATLGERS